MTCIDSFRERFPSFADKRSEKHAIGIGASVGFIVGLRGGKDSAWMFIILASIALGAKEVNVGHLEDVQDEPGYALVSSVVMFIITVFVINPRLRGGVL